MMVRYLFALLFFCSSAAFAQGSLGVSISHTDLSCNGSGDGTATATASNGTAPYTYLWLPMLQSTPSISGLSAGTYICIVTDAVNDTARDTVVITEPTALILTVSQTNVFCNGAHTGIATVMANGGTMPYTYTWTPTVGNGPNATGLAGGNYTCVVKDGNGCSATATFLIAEPAPYVSAVVSTPIKCFGDSTGTANIFVSGGTQPYKYAWNPNTEDTLPTVTGLPAGSYTCTITDANFCTHQEVVVIPSVAKLTLSDSAADLLCTGDGTGYAEVRPAGGTPPYSYFWNPGVSTVAMAPGLQAGTYMCTVADANNCLVRDTFVITEPDTFKALRVSKRNVVCAGRFDGWANAVPTGGTLPYNYAWSPGSATDSLYWGLAPGTYTCTITDANGCTFDTSVTIVDTSGFFSFNASATDVGCRSARLNAKPDKNSLAAMSYMWYFSDGDTSSRNPVVHTYPSDSPNTATVVVTDSVGCTDTISLDVNIHYVMYADFSKDPNGPNPNKPIKFLNASAPNASHFTWDFGDGTSSTAENPLKVFADSGMYHVCLVARDSNSCGDTVCKDVLVDADKVIAVPSAFSPNGDGENDMLIVHGFRVKSFDLKIYNRWGQQMFETTQMSWGWDGTWKGQKMPEDSYGYVLDVHYSDGTSEQKGGSITLLR